MTLYRKSLIPWYVHGGLYSAALLLSIYYMQLTVVHVAAVAAVFALRTQLSIGKYPLWLTFAFLSSTYFKNELLPMMIGQ